MLSNDIDLLPFVCNQLKEVSLGSIWLRICNE